MIKRGALTAMGGVVLALLAGASPPAQAQENMTWGGGPMRNLYVDVIFWGNFCPSGYMCPEAQNVLDYVNDLTAFLRGADNPPGLEPAIHYYGVGEIYPGDYVVGPQSLGSYGPPGTDQAGIDQVQAVVAAAQNGSYGGAYDVANSSDWVGQSLPTGSNRLALVVTIGGNSFDDYGTAAGFHQHNNQTIYAAAQWEDRSVLSHEIFESMTDPFPFGGWAGDLEIPLPEFWNATYPEVADQCGSSSYDGNYTTGSPTAQSYYDSYLSWAGTSEGGDISGITSITVNPPFLSAYTALYGATCELFIPEQHAPMAATFEYGYRSQPLSLFYVDVNGAVQDLQWDNAGQPLSSQFSFGPPSSTVRAVGKPAVVYATYGVGERLFVKGSDGALWMHYYPNGGTGSWLSLGGVFYGDPAPVLWNSGQRVDVFVVGTDDHLYFYTLTGSTLYGWSSVPNGNGFLGSPKVVSRDGVNTFDIFAPTENGKLEWIAYNSTTGWAAPVALPDLGGQDLGTPVVTAQNTTQMQVFENSPDGMFQTMWNGSGWNYATDLQFVTDRVDTEYGLQGGLAVTSWGTNHLDAFGISRAGNLYWWWSNTAPFPFNTWTCSQPADCTLSPSLVGNNNSVTPLISGAPLASGDPLAISRSAGENEVFYRAVADGSLVHLTYSNGAWQAPEFVPASIQ